MGREYIIKETSENVWSIMDENGNIIRVITKDVIINYCKKIFENNHAECMSAKIVINSVWRNLKYDYNFEFVDNYCQEFDRFLAWFDYTCVEYHSKKVIAFYKQRLLHFE